jgi:hypothetical protein
MLSAGIRRGVGLYATQAEMAQLHMTSRFGGACFLTFCRLTLYWTWFVTYFLGAELS